MRNVTFSPVLPDDIRVNDVVELKNRKGTFTVKKWVAGSSYFNAYGGTPGRAGMRTFRKDAVRSAKRPTLAVAKAVRP